MFCISGADDTNTSLDRENLRIQQLECLRPDLDSGGLRFGANRDAPTEKVAFKRLFSEHRFARSIK